VVGSGVRFTGEVVAISDRETMDQALAWLDAKRRHVLDQVEAMPSPDRRRSRLPSGWTPLGAVHHLALDVERFWFRAVMAGADVELPTGYEGWTAPEEQTDEEILELYAAECRAATSAVDGMSPDEEPRWWFPGAGSAPYTSLREVVLHVLVETATHAGQLDVCRELVDGGQRLVLDVPD
jgi:uncharacterized damage-inducible protein DinB